MATTFGSSGSLVGAALESAGFYYQSYVLDQLTSPLTSSAGALVYMIGILFAMVTFAMTGKYKLGLWFFIGPGIFLATILDRVETTGTDWKFGGQIRNAERLKTEVTGIVEAHGKISGDAKVSALFAWYNSLVSSTIDGVVKVISDGRISADVRFIINEQINGVMKMQMIDEPLFREFVHHAFLTDCREVAEAGRQMRDPMNNDAERASWKVKFDKGLTNTYVELSNPSVEYLAGVAADFPGTWNADIISGSSSGLGPVIQGYRNGTLNTDPTQWGREFEQAKRAIQANNHFSCKEIWNLVYGGLLRNAIRTVDSAVDRGVKHGVSEDQIVADFAKASGAFTADLGSTGEKVEALYKLTSQYILRNEIDRGSAGAFVSDYARRASEIRTIEAPAENDLSWTERARVANKEWQEKTALMAAASNIWYYQGLALYTLAVTFPFFALMLLMPGKHAGFLLWFMLWLWVKSWDIGYAIVMLMNDILFSLFSRSGPPIPLNPDAYKNLDAAMYALREIDPTFQMSTYYQIIGAALLAIPPMSAQLVMGSMKGGAGMISAGVGQFAGSFGERAQGMQGMAASASLRGMALDEAKSRSDAVLSNVMSSQNMYTGINPPAPDGVSGQRRSAGYHLPGIGAIAAEANGQPGSPLTGSGMKGDIGAAKLQGTAIWASVASRAIDGFIGASGRFDDQIPGGAIRDAKAGRSVMRSTLGAASALVGGDMAMQNLESGLKRDAAWANYDAWGDSKNLNYAEQAQAYGSMSLPWTIKNQAGDDLKYEVQNWQQVLGMFGNAASAGQKGITGRTQWLDENERRGVDDANRAYKNFGASSLLGPLGAIASPFAFSSATNLFSSMFGVSEADAAEIPAELLQQQGHNGADKTGTNKKSQRKGEQAESAEAQFVLGAGVSAGTGRSSVASPVASSASSTSSAAVPVAAGSATSGGAVANGSTVSGNALAGASRASSSVSAVGTPQAAATASVSDSAQQQRRRARRAEEGKKTEGGVSAALPGKEVTGGEQLNGGMTTGEGELGRYVTSPAVESRALSQETQAENERKKAEELWKKIQGEDVEKPEGKRGGTSAEGSLALGVEQQAGESVDAWKKRLDGEKLQELAGESRGASPDLVAAVSTTPSLGAASSWMTTSESTAPATAIGAAPTSAPTQTPEQTGSQKQEKKRRAKKTDEAPATVVVVQPETAAVGADSPNNGLNAQGEELAPQLGRYNLSPSVDMGAPSSVSPRDVTDVSLTPSDREASIDPGVVAGQTRAQDDKAQIDAMWGISQGEEGPKKGPADNEGPSSVYSITPNTSATPAPVPAAESNTATSPAAAEAPARCQKRKARSAETEEALPTVVVVQPETNVTASNSLNNGNEEQAAEPLQLAGRYGLSPSVEMPAPNGASQRDVGNVQLTPVSAEMPTEANVLAGQTRVQDQAKSDALLGITPGEEDLKKGSADEEGPRSVYSITPNTATTPASVSAAESNTATSPAAEAAPARGPKRKGKPAEVEEAPATVVVVQPEVNVTASNSLNNATEEQAAETPQLTGRYSLSPSVDMGAPSSVSQASISDVSLASAATEAPAQQQRMMVEQIGEQDTRAKTDALLGINQGEEGPKKGSADDDGAQSVYSITPVAAARAPETYRAVDAEIKMPEADRRAPEGQTSDISTSSPSGQTNISPTAETVGPTVGPNTMDIAENPIAQSEVKRSDVIGTEAPPLAQAPSAATPQQQTDSSVEMPTANNRLEGTAPQRETEQQVTTPLASSVEQAQPVAPSVIEAEVKGSNLAASSATVAKSTKKKDKQKAEPTAAETPTVIVHKPAAEASSKEGDKEVKVGNGKESAGMDVAMAADVSGGARPPVNGVNGPSGGGPERPASERNQPEHEIGVHIPTAEQLKNAPLEEIETLNKHNRQHLDEFIDKNRDIIPPVAFHGTDAEGLKGIKEIGQASAENKESKESATIWIAGVDKQSTSTEKYREDLMYSAELALASAKTKATQEGTEAGGVVVVSPEALELGMGSQRLTETEKGERGEFASRTKAEIDASNFKDVVRGEIALSELKTAQVTAGEIGLANKELYARLRAAEELAQTEVVVKGLDKFGVIDEAKARGTLPSQIEALATNKEALLESVLKKPIDKPELLTQEERLALRDYVSSDKGKAVYESYFGSEVKTAEAQKAFQLFLAAEYDARYVRQSDDAGVKITEPAQSSTTNSQSINREALLESVLKKPVDKPETFSEDERRALREYVSSPESQKAYDSYIGSKVKTPEAEKAFQLFIAAEYDARYVRQGNNTEVKAEVKVAEGKATDSKVTESKATDSKADLSAPVATTNPQATGREVQKDEVVKGAISRRADRSEVAVESRESRPRSVESAEVRNEKSEKRSAPTAVSNAVKALAEKLGLANVEEDVEVVIQAPEAKVKKPENNQSSITLLVEEEQGYGGPSVERDFEMGKPLIAPSLTNVQAQMAQKRDNRDGQNDEDQTGKRRKST